MCSLCVLGLWQITLWNILSTPSVSCAAQTMGGSRNVCWVLSQVLRTDICGSRYCIWIKCEFLSYFEIMHHVSNLNYRQPFFPQRLMADTPLRTEMSYSNLSIAPKLFLCFYILQVLKSGYWHLIRRLHTWYEILLSQFCLHCDQILIWLAPYIRIRREGCPLITGLVVLLSTCWNVHGQVSERKLLLMLKALHCVK